MDEVQYCVVLEEGSDKKIPHYVWASREKIEKTMKTLDENYSHILKKEGVVSFTNSDRKISFTKRNGVVLIGSLEILVYGKIPGISIFNELSKN